MSELKDVTLYNEGWFADCDLCAKHIAWGHTKAKLMRGLRKARDAHQGPEYACMQEWGDSA